MITIENFSKHFGSVHAVEDVSLSVQRGELFGVIGPDGAGKTTTMRTLCTLLPIEAGAMRIGNFDVTTDITAIRNMLGYMPQHFSLYPDLSVQQNLLFFADLFGVPRKEKQERLQRLYQFSKLEPFKRRLAKQLSGGMKQKLALSCTLIHTPEVLILDEPTTGVDPVSRREFWEILKRLRAEGVTMLVSTPYMDEATLCDRVAFMHEGKILAVDRPAEMKNHFAYVLFEVTSDNAPATARYLQTASLSHAVHVFGDRVHVSFTEEPSSDAVAALQQQAPVPMKHFQRIEPGMEDIFMALMRPPGAPSHDLRQVTRMNRAEP